MNNTGWLFVLLAVCKDCSQITFWDIAHFDLCLLPAFLCSTTLQRCCPLERGFSRLISDFSTCWLFAFGRVSVSFPAFPVVSLCRFWDSSGVGWCTHRGCSYSLSVLLWEEKPCKFTHSMFSFMKSLTLNF